jgi:hypothetical protein
LNTCSQPSAANRHSATSGIGRTAEKSFVPDNGFIDVFDSDSGEHIAYGHRE